MVSRSGSLIFWPKTFDCNWFDIVGWEFQMVSRTGSLIFWPKAFDCTWFEIVECEIVNFRWLQDLGLWSFGPEHKTLNWFDMAFIFKSFFTERFGLLPFGWDGWFICWNCLTEPWFVSVLFWVFPPLINSNSLNIRCFYDLLFKQNECWWSIIINLRFSLVLPFGWVKGIWIPWLLKALALFWLLFLWVAKLLKLLEVFFFFLFSLLVVECEF